MYTFYWPIIPGNVTGRASLNLYCLNIGVETIKQWLGAKIVFCRQNILKRTICCLSPLATVIMTKQRLLWSSKTAERKSQDQDGQLCVKHLPGWFASQPVSTRRSQCLWSRQVPTDQSNWIKQVNIFNSNPSKVQSQVIWIYTCSYTGCFFLTGTPPKNSKLEKVNIG